VDLNLRLAVIETFSANVLGVENRRSGLGIGSFKFCDLYSNKALFGLSQEPIPLRRCFERRTESSPSEREGATLMHCQCPNQETIVWFIGQPSTIQKLLRNSIHKRTGIACRTAASSTLLPWKKLNLNTKWLILQNAQGLDEPQLEALLLSIENRRNCLKTIYNVSVERKQNFEQLAFESGWHGVFHIGIGLEKMINGIIGLLEGRLWFQREAILNSKHLDLPCMDCKVPYDTALTTRERQILCVIARGATNREISDYLKISQHTVKTHIYNIYQKIKVPNRLQAAIWASDNLVVR
jgi:LuxR family transcriptional regulator, positive regulator of biofilm formation